MRFFYSAEHLGFLADNYPLMEISDLTEAFNERFGLDKSPESIKSCLTNHRIRAGRRGMLPGKHLTFSAEHIEFIKHGYRRHDLADLHAAFVKKFGPCKSMAQLRSFIHNHGIQSGRNGQFEKGHRPANKGIKGWQAGGRAVETQFKPGHGGTNNVPMYSERICSKDGYILIKVPEPNPYTGASSRFVAKHRWIWEQQNGPIPDGFVVSFIDGDKLNCVIENLELISRNELRYRNKSGYNDLPADIKPTMAAIIKLDVRRFEAERKSQ